VTTTDDFLKTLPDKTESCDSHGEYKSHNYFSAIWSQCPVCAKDDKAAREIEEEAEERKKRREKWEHKLGHACIPERFQTRTLDSFSAQTPEQIRALTFATEYAAKFSDAIKTGRCAIFVGGPGTGKTHLAVGIGLRVMGAENRTVLFTTVMRAVRRVKDSWSRESDETETQAIAAMAHPDLLILDEVGVQFGSEFEQNIMFDLMNERYERRRPTILLSNLPTDQLIKYIGARVFDRMREDGGTVVAFDWPSHRGK